MKFFFILTLLIFLFSIMGLFIIKQSTGNFLVTNDFYFHFYKAQGKCFTENYSLKTCQNYPPLFSIVSSFFSQSEFIFILFILMVLIFLIPFIIYLETKSVWSLLIYFSSSFAYQILFSSILAQMFFSIFFILILKEKKINFTFLVYCVLAFFSHYSLFISIFVIVFFNVFYFKIKTVKKFILSSYAFIHIQQFNLSFIFKLLPIPFFYNLFELELNKILTIFVFLIAAFFINIRVLLLVTLCLCMWLPEIIEKKDEKYRFYLFLLCLGYIVFQFFIWFYDIYQTNLSIMF